jgi:hypothetical protein
MATQKALLAELGEIDSRIERTEKRIERAEARRIRIVGILKKLRTELTTHTKEEIECRRELLGRIDRPLFAAAAKVEEAREAAGKEPKNGESLLPDNSVGQLMEGDDAPDETAEPYELPDTRFGGPEVLAKLRLACASRSPIGGWNILIKRGANNVQLMVAIGEAFGLGGGRSGPGDSGFWCKGGAKPTFTDTNDATAAPVLKGAQLRDAVRHILAIPKDPTATRLEQFSDSDNAAKVATNAGGVYVSSEKAQKVLHAIPRPALRDDGVWQWEIPALRDAIAKVTEHCLDGERGPGDSDQVVLCDGCGSIRAAWMFDCPRCHEKKCVPADVVLEDLLAFEPDEIRVNPAVVQTFEDVEGDGDGEPLFGYEEPAKPESAKSKKGRGSKAKRPDAMISRWTSATLFAKAREVLGMSTPSHHALGSLAVCIDCQKCIFANSAKCSGCGGHNSEPYHAVMTALHAIEREGSAKPTRVPNAPLQKLANHPLVSSTGGGMEFTTLDPRDSRRGWEPETIAAAIELMEGPGGKGESLTACAHCKCIRFRAVESCPRCLGDLRATVALHELKPRSAQPISSSEPKRGRGRPPGAKNKSKQAAAQTPPP